MQLNEDDEELELQYWWMQQDQDEEWINQLEEGNDGYDEVWTQ